MSTTRPSSSAAPRPPRMRAGRARQSWRRFLPPAGGDRRARRWSVLFLAAGGLRAGDRAVRPGHTDFARRCSRRRARTCSAPTSSAATCSPGSCTARASRCWSACWRGSGARRRRPARAGRRATTAAARPGRDLALTDIVLAFPFLVLAVGLAAILGPSLSTPPSRSASPVPGIIRVTRGETLRCARMDFVARRSPTAPATRRCCAGTSCPTRPAR